VIYEQRSPERRSTAAVEAERPPWRPAEGPFAEGGRAPAAGDRYVAIDRIDDGVVTLAVAPWPTVEPGTGRLDFGHRRDRSTAFLGAATFQARVDRDRAAAGQLVRPIRPGDAFLVAGYDADPEAWAEVVDVTRSGRLAAKAALFSTAAPAPAAADLPDYGLAPEIAEDRGPAEAPPVATPGAAGSGEPGGEAPPPGPVAYPAV
jgi:hypothetical protein